MRPEEPVTLADGSRVLIRTVAPVDKPLFVQGWERFGDESRHRRFLSPKHELSDRELAYFTELDHDDHEALGAIDADTREGLGVARYVRLRGRPDTAEAAVAVIDAWQGRGLGGILLERLADRAAEHGIEHFSASLFASNRSMLALFSRLGRMRVTRDGSETLEIDVELPASDRTVLRDALRAAACGDVRALQA
jgi:GNAT superfamily N-acetyltransferase